MDSVRALEILAGTRPYWVESKKNIPFDNKFKDGRETISLLFSCGPYQVILDFVIGKRCGLQEQCIIIDTQKKEFDADHMYVASVTSYGRFNSPPLLDLSEEVLEARKTKDRSALKLAVKSWLSEIITELEKSPEKILTLIEDFRHEIEECFDGTSIVASRYANTRN